MDASLIKSLLLSLLVIVVAKAASIKSARNSVLSSDLADSSSNSQSSSSSIYPDGDRRNYYIAHACERTILTMSCTDGRKIQLVHARYGRQNMQHCNNGRHADAFMWSNRCMAPVHRTTRVVADMCNGRQHCAVPVVNMLFSDPCPTTFKYLEIYYICINP